MADARENRQGLQSISDAASSTAVSKVKRQRSSAQVHDPSQKKLILVPQTTQKWQSLAPLEKPTCTSPVTPLPAKVTEAPEAPTAEKAPILVSDSSQSQILDNDSQPQEQIVFEVPASQPRNSPTKREEVKHDDDESTYAPSSSAWQSSGPKSESGGWSWTDSSAWWKEGKWENDSQYIGTDVSQTEIEEMSAEVHAMPIAEPTKHDEQCDDESGDNDGDGEESLASQLDAAVKAGEFASGSALGRRCRRECKDDPEWKRCKGWTEKNKFRVKWAKLELDKIHYKKIHAEETYKDTRNKGRWLNFESLASAEGGGHITKTSLMAAKNYSTMCLKLGAEWVQVHPWTKLREFRYVKEETTGGFRQSWKTEDIETSDQTTRPGIHTKVEPNSIPSSQAKAQVKAKCAPKPKTSPPVKGDNTMSAQLRKAALVKKELQTLLAQADRMVKMIESDERGEAKGSPREENKWSWAKGEAKELTRLQEEIESGFSDWDADFMLLEVADMKNKYSAEDNMTGASTFRKHEAKATSLKDKVEELRDMHKAKWAKKASKQHL